MCQCPNIYEPNCTCRLHFHYTVHFCTHKFTISEIQISGVPLYGTRVHFYECMISHLSTKTEGGKEKEKMYWINQYISQYQESIKLSRVVVHQRPSEMIRKEKKGICILCKWSQILDQVDLKTDLHRHKISMSTFIWKNKHPKMKLEKLQLPAVRGGLAEPNLQSLSLVNIIEKCIRIGGTRLWINMVRPSIAGNRSLLSLSIVPK